MTSKILFWCTAFPALQGIEKNCGCEKVGTSSGRDSPGEKVLIELMQSGISGISFRSARRKHRPGASLHQGCTFRTTAVENAGIVECCHEAEKRTQSARRLRLSIAARGSKSGQSDIYDMRKVGICFATCSGESITTSDDGSVRQKLRTREVRQT